MRTHPSLSIADDQALIERLADLEESAGSLRGANLSRYEIEDRVADLQDELEDCKRQATVLRSITVTIPRERVDRFVLMMHANRLILADPEDEGSGTSDVSLLDNLIAEAAA
jgi:hypothetical protein